MKVLSQRKSARMATGHAAKFRAHEGWGGSIASGDLSILDDLRAHYLGFKIVSHPGPPNLVAFHVNLGLRGKSLTSSKDD